MNRIPKPIMLKPPTLAALNELGREEISEAFELLRRRAKVLEAQTAITFQPGQKVKFLGKRKEWLQGVVKSVNQTTVSVEVPRQPFPGGWPMPPVTWRVAASLLSAA